MAAHATAFSYLPVYCVILYWPCLSGRPGIISWATQTSCVAMNGQNEVWPGRWITKSCADTAFPLCERPRSGYKQPPLPTLAPEDIPCPPDWIPLGPNCYQVCVTPNMSSAQLVCSGFFLKFCFLDYIFINFLLD